MRRRSAPTCASSLSDQGQCSPPSFHSATYAISFPRRALDPAPSLFALCTAHSSFLRLLASNHASRNPSPCWASRLGQRMRIFWPSAVKVLNLSPVFHHVPQLEITMWSASNGVLLHLAPHRSFNLQQTFTSASTSPLLSFLSLRSLPDLVQPVPNEHARQRLAACG